MSVDYIIIQAGGKGTRLKQLTQNKPKGIVPVNNIPIIFNLFNRYPDKHFIVIGNYKHEVLEEYLETFCKVKYITVKAEGIVTCAGLRSALNYIPEKTPFAIVWSDLILGNEVDIDSCDDGNYIGISKDFECRWSFNDGIFQEIASKEHGVAGLFVFRDKQCIKTVPQEGEFVRWLGQTELTFSEFSLAGTKEIGTLLALAENSQTNYRCRAFNSLEIRDDVIIKRPVDDQGRRLAVRELNWYREVQKYKFEQIPQIYTLEPLTMQRIDGENIFRTNLSIAEKRTVIDRLVTSLERLHTLASAPADMFSILDAYYYKTIKRIESVRDLIPFAADEYIRINGKNCRNPYFYKAQFRQRVKELLCDCQEFSLIHGDCTFSNTMVDSDLNIIFLDPRGYFGFSELYGDVYYDWAKVYYSVYGDYDQFNNKNFTLRITDQEVRLDIATNGWREVADYFLDRITNCDAVKIRFLHAIVWLSLTTYTWEDYDSICGAFYNGTYLLEEFL